MADKDDVSVITSFKKSNHCSVANMMKLNLKNPTAIWQPGFAL